MKQDQLISTQKRAAQQKGLQEQIVQLKLELNDLSHKLETFEVLLRSRLTHELIETQELSVLYKAQKKEKKSKRLAQKKKGKSYIEPVGLKTQKQKVSRASLNEDDIAEKKRLYREAMLHVHPDKYSMNDDKMDLATELTTRLVEIYKHEDLDTLKAYHAHLFSNAELTKIANVSFSKIELIASPDAYLIKEKEQLEKDLKDLKSRHTYHILTNYKDPLTFLDELKVYYHDRISKLRKRTRIKTEPG
ncbi:MAG: hypothetical protein ACJAZM_002120 [Cyclobacteriaceae bacterium]|jgi:hypothetical protein